MVMTALKRIWHDALHEERRLRLADVLERGGGRMPDEASDLYSTAAAARRCVFCNAKPACDAWLAAGRHEGLEEFCPNADFIRHRTNLR